MRRPAALRRRRRVATLLPVAAAMLLPELAAGNERNPQLVNQLRASGAAVTGLGRDHGLSGFLIEPANSPPYTLYVTASGAGLVGQLYDPGGLSLSRPQLAAALAGRTAARPGATDERTDAAATATDGAGGTASPDRPPDIRQRPGARPASGGGRAVSSLVAASLASGHAVRAGHPEIVVFADPACRHSRDWLATLAAAAPEPWGLRLIPVAVLGEWSARAAMAVISAADPIAAWRRLPDAAAADLQAAAAAELAANNVLLERWRAATVPFTLYPSAAGGYRSREGAAADAAGFLAGLAAATGD